VLKIYSIRNVNYRFLALAVNFGTQPKYGQAQKGDSGLVACIHTHKRGNPQISF